MGQALSGSFGTLQAFPGSTSPVTLMGAELTAATGSVAQWAIAAAPGTDSLVLGVSFVTQGYC